MKTIMILFLLAVASACEAPATVADSRSAAAAAPLSSIVGAWSPVLSGPSVSFSQGGTFEWYTIGSYSYDSVKGALTLVGASGAITYFVQYPGYCGVDTHGVVIPAECLVLQDAFGNLGTYHRL